MYIYILISFVTSHQLAFYPCSNTPTCSRWSPSTTSPAKVAPYKVAGWDLNISFDICFDLFMDAWISWFISSPMQLDFDDLSAILQHYCLNKTSPNFRRPFLTCWIPCCFKFLEFLVAEKPLQSCSTSRWCWTASWRIICFPRFTRYGRRIWSGSDDSRCMGATQLGRLGCGVWCRMKPLVGWSCCLSFSRLNSIHVRL